MAHQTLILILVAVAATVSACGNNGSPPPTVENPAFEKPEVSTGSIHGRIVMIMADGHVEPARVPEITLVRIWNRQNEHETAAYREFRAHLPEGSDQILHPLKCSLLYSTYRLANSAARVADDKNPAGKADLLQFKGDEEGNFEFSKADPDRYELIAFGQAGLYRNVLWEDVIDIEAGQEVKVTVNFNVQTCR